MVVPAQAPKNYSWLANLSGRYKVLLAICPLLGLFLLTSLATLNALRQQEQMRNWAQHSYDVLLTIDQALEANQRAVIGMRGYVLSLDRTELASFEGARGDFAGRMHRLRALTSDNPLQQARIDRVNTLVDSWTSDIGRGLIAPLKALPQVDSADTSASRMTIRQHYVATRKATAPDITAVLAQMAASERDLLAQRKQHLQGTLLALRIISVLAALAGLLFGLYVMRMTIRLIVHPLRQITDLMNRVAARDTSVTVTRLGRRDEIGELARALQVFKQMAIDIGEQAWVKSQLTLVSRHLQQATTHREFGSALTSQLAPLLHAGVAMYYHHDDATGRLDLIGSYGLRQAWDPVAGYAPGEGLVGQCVVERQALMLDQVPDGYVRVHSASGEASPSHVAILPVMYREEVTGVLEIAGFDAPDTARRELLAELLPLIALTQENLNRATNTQALLQQTRQQADELRASADAMRAQQEALHRSNDSLTQKTVELQEQSRRLVASEEQLRVQADKLQSSNEELREKTESLNRQRYVLEDLQQETAQKADELARASQYKSDFLANMSHELRTPLNSLLILSRSLADNDTGNLDEEQVESARIIHDAGTSLLHLINDILDLSKIEAGKMELVIDELPLADLAQRLRRTFAHVAQEKALDFSVTVEPGLPAILHTDGAKLEQVTNNLLSNAFKFTAHGTVAVHIGRPAPGAELPATLAGRPLIALTVSDSGIGIPTEKFQRIFNAFEQVDAGTSRQFGGTGLGLAISRRIAQLLGGDITLHSESGHGSRFTVLLPQTPPGGAMRAGAHEAAAAAPGARPRALPAAVDEDKAGHVTVLVIEDDPAFAGILINLIQRRGYRALAASDGESGLQLARGHRPHGILLDVMLPLMDGWTVIDQLKSDPLTASIPVHFISATDEVSRGLDTGAVGFLIKPVSREAIALALDRLLRDSSARARRLLVVDDDPASRAAVRSTLRGEGVLIDEAGSAEQALSRIAEVRYDCLVLDLGLPGMSGLELLDRLAGSEQGLPRVVVYSGRDLSAQEDLQLRQYTDAIVLKGSRAPAQLLQEVSQFLNSVGDVAVAEPPAAAAPAAVDAVPAERSPPSLPPAVDGLAGHKVLLVDDDMRNLFALSRVLRGWGMLVSLAQDGQKALRALEADPTTELVLMDVMMPVMDGYETIRAVRAQAQFADLPIIALTAKAMIGDREKCLEMGASEYLSKPIDTDLLATVIRRWLTC